MDEYFGLGYAVGTIWGRSLWDYLNTILAQGILAQDHIGSDHVGVVLYCSMAKASAMQLKSGMRVQICGLGEKPDFNGALVY